MSHAPETPSASSVDATPEPQAQPARCALATGSVLVPFFKHGPMVMLHVACNDGDNGMFSGKCEALEIQYGRDLDDRLSFSPNFFDWSPAFVVDWEKQWLQIGGLPRINYTKHGGHVGNWCWDCFKVRREDAANLITHPKIRKWFSLDEAPTDLWEAYHGRLVANAPNS
jgi:hypothetical protein